MLGIGHELRPFVRQAVAELQRAGVRVVLCSGGDPVMANAVATRSGILFQEQETMTGRELQLRRKAALDVVPRLRVLASSSPQDKAQLVLYLKDLEEVVGVTGYYTDDLWALREADIAFTMGSIGLDSVKAESHILIDNFASIVKAVLWGRCVHDAPRKFLQHQVTASISTAFITLISVAASSQAVVPPAQLIWINLFMDAFPAIALTTGQPSAALIFRKPLREAVPSIFTVDVNMQILCQSLTQCITFVIIRFAGARILAKVPHVAAGLDGAAVASTIAFNTFVFAQIFNLLNCRIIDNKRNFFAGLLRDRFLILLILAGS